MAAGACRQPWARTSEGNAGNRAVAVGRGAAHLRQAIDRGRSPAAPYSGALQVKLSAEAASPPR